MATERARGSSSGDEVVKGDPPARPRLERDLNFKRQRPVEWFAPNVLADAGLRVLLSSAFGEFLDKRELQASVETEPLVHRVDAEEIWFDFVSDSGDGFDPTYTIAWLAARAELTLVNHDQRLPRGGLVVFGGDEVYPVGNPDAYEDKFTRPYKASLPWLPGDNPDLYAIPGNHDWYDGLTSFFRVFCQGRWIGARRTRQTRSYFAIQLPHRWWIWGIDIQLDTYIDEPQQQYFRAVDLQPGDRIILCTASPSWVDGPDSRGFKNLDFVERTLIAPRRARLVLSLSGDSHHYAHFVGDDNTHKVTAGGGGAFLHPTHVLPTEPIELPIGSEEAPGTQAFTLTNACYPARRTSRGLSWGAALLPFKNRTFMVIPAVFYVLLGWASQFSLRAFGELRGLDDSAVQVGWFDILLGLVRNPVSVLLLVLFLGGMVGFAKPPHRWSERTQKLAKWPMAIVHLLLHVTAVVFLGIVAVELVSRIVDGGFWFTALLLVVMGGIGGVVGGMITGLYLAASCALLGAHDNEAFSAMRSTSYKNFLRLHLGTDGVLTVYPIGVKRAVSKWRLDPDNPDPGASWLAPDGIEPAAHLIEDPFSIDGRGPQG